LPKLITCLARIQSLPCMHLFLPLFALIPALT
jgi:hypothetical protein